MTTGKRASMREGPLAALFRKTAEDSAEAAQSDVTESEPPKPQDRLRHAFSADIPDTGERHIVPDREPEPGGPQAAAGPEPEAVDAPEPEAGGPEPEAVDAPEPEAGGPEPEAVGAPEPEAGGPEPEADVYARPERSSEGFAARKPIGTPVLRVVGIGGAGVNAINRMVEADIVGVEFLAINTDLQSLQQSAAHETLHIGDSITRGLGSGSDPELGRQAARTEYDRIKSMLRGSDMVFIAAGAGGGTGTGAAPVVAEIARELGALTVGIVTRPFHFEGSRRRDQAEAGIAALADEVDTLIVVPNNRLLSVLDRNASMVEAFRVADDVLRQGVQGIADLVTLPGLINLDFADVRTIMSEAGTALLGIGMGTGERRAIDAAEGAVASPLLETSMEGSRSILLSITGSPDLTLWEVNESAKAVGEAAHPDANIIFGAMVDDRLEDQVWVTVVATGYGDGRPRRQRERSLVGERNGLEPRRSLREPAREPRVSRSRTRQSPADLDVPEFIPRR